MVEREVELRFALYPGLDPSQQSLKGVLWAFYGKVLYYMKEDRFISGKFMTVNLVYNDVQRVDNEPVGFGKVPDSYRPMYDGRWSGSLPLAPYSGQTSGSPYYHPLWDIICIILSIELRLCVIAMRRIVMLMVMELLMIPKQIGICHLCLRWI